ncbi:permease [Thermoanaerobacterium sp. RBIITD]|uniref:permease n=1 Tax=Thermoanaerobacterium sp. RBIITD TaxID=1550240 RepID=UPI000BB6DCDC|nr:permease [Thermoanaerobacterium sp. RBIITD]SNX53970.1 hypothetical protein SAMN05660242_1590 [Thermoanaerobacterium sp. RBIITD]
MLNWIADFIVYKMLGLKGHLGDALHFFIYDSIKIFLLLLIIIFAVTFIRSYFPPEKVKKYLSKKNEYVGNVLAALLGIVTPFCSCSAVPLFIGFVESGIPLGVTFSFLISSPMVNEVALVMLWGLFGWKISLIYILTGVIVAIISGIVIGKLHLEHLVESFVYEMKMGEEALIAEITLNDRINQSLSYTKSLIKKIWLYVLIGIALGGFIHGYVPADFIIKYAGRGNIFAVPIAVLIGIPMYSNAAGTIPIIQALLGKGIQIGTALALMMSITALSLPELIILKNVLKPKLIAIFVGIVGISIIFVGYLFNFII